jgi:hypothetical protein
MPDLQCKGPWSQGRRSDILAGGDGDGETGGNRNYGYKVVLWAASLPPPLSESW